MPRFHFVAAVEATLHDLVGRPPSPMERREGLQVAAMTVVFGAIFTIFLSKYTGGFLARWPFDQVWHQAFVDYDATWRTPFASIPGNILNHFDIRLPVNSRALPVLGLSQLFPPALRVPAGYALLFAGMMLLFWAVGRTFGLAPAPRAFFAGSVALMAVIPSGLDKVFWLLPPDFFTSQFLLATWWGEAPMLALATIVSFYWVGQCRSALGDGLASLAFVLGCALAVIAYPAGGVYFIPLIAIYCAVFLVTSRGRLEWSWKAALCALVLAAGLALKVPQFLANLYGYTFGSYFLSYVQAPTLALLHDTFMVVVRGVDPRGVLIFVTAIVFAVVMNGRGPRPLRRFSQAFLVCELAIVAASCANAFTVRAPILFAYAETAHSALWGSYFVLVCMAIAIVVDRRLATLPVPHWLVARRRSRYVVGLAIVMLAYLVFAPRPNIVAYPPRKPAPVALLENELSLIPGAPFRGRVLTLYAPEGDEAFYSIALRYRRALGNDLYEELLPFGIPTVNESQHWTSPVTFAFLFRFFAQAGDAFDKNFFWLDRYDAKIAKLIGVRMVVSDSELGDGTPVFEQRVGDRMLRIYRIDESNLGQYSPTHPVVVNTAAAAIAAIESDNFDPRRDVVVEGQPPVNLVPAQSVSIVAEQGPRLHVRAVAAGRSLIVLPFEFSHCLRLTGTPTARLMPVNLQQVGLLFEQIADVSIDYEYSLLDSTCRGVDLARAKALRLDEIVRPQRPDAVRSAR